MFIHLLLLALAFHAAAKVAEAQSGRFVLSGGEAYDRKTALTWKRCMYGLAWNGHTCAGGGIKLVTWFDAMDMRDGEWRVPTKAEMDSLFFERPGYPKLDVQAFPDAAGRPEISYWTSAKIDACLENGNRACAMVDSFNGERAAYSPFGGTPGIFHMALRMVRSGEAPHPPDSARAAEQPRTTGGRWMIQGGEAYDTKTGLRWQRCNAGLTYAGQLGCQGAPREYTFAEALKLEGGGWRLPTGSELDTLFYHGPVEKGMPFLDPSVFLELDPNRAKYWSSTPSTKDCATCRGPFCEGNCEYDANGVRVSRFVYCGNYLIGWNCMICKKTESRVARLVRAGR